jgi:hypothetical protein
MTSAQVRDRLVEAMRLDLIGPQPGNFRDDLYSEELLPTAPSAWYLTGFLVPHEAPFHARLDDTGNDQDDLQDKPRASDDDQTPEGASARKVPLPSSVGLSVLVPEGVERLTARVMWGDYVPVEAAGKAAGLGGWRRCAREAEVVLSLGERGVWEAPVPEAGGLKLVTTVRPTAPSSRLPSGTRSASVFLVNARTPVEGPTKDRAWVFQPELVLTSPRPFVARAATHGLEREDWDEQVADLQHRDALEYAVGHNIAACAVLDEASKCREVKTEWMPVAQVEKVVPASLSGVEVGMEALGAASSHEALVALLGSLPDAYGAWVQAQGATLPLDEPRRAQVGRDLLRGAERARRRIAQGLAVLADPTAREAFGLANRAVAQAIRQRATHGRPGAKPDEGPAPAWRPFQLAFLLMNLAGIADPHHPDREVVDLLFFPTGGGKTEAYLGLAAFALAHRRLQDPSIQSAGVTVLMRYTLRLLTLDQLGRAATLVCALELARQADPARLGQWPFEIGLWVGQAATPNRMGRQGDGNPDSARERTMAYQNDARRPSPIPLEECPWCGHKFTKDSFSLYPDTKAPTELRVGCVNRACDFYSRRQARGLPLLAVDEPLYRRLPCFVIATVDKFAAMPWVGETAGLFGKVTHHDAHGFSGPGSAGGVGGQRLKGPLPPPALIIQDELHLISGPLGTMVGLYEAAIDALCRAEGGAGPKIVASTATVRRAEKQIRALFGRQAVEVFPPPGPDRRDSFFAKTVSPSERQPRTYLGVAAQGRNLKVVMLRSYLALMSAAQRLWVECGGDKVPHNPVDPYMTLVGYFNSLRELGGSRRIIEDEVRHRLEDYARQRHRPHDPAPMFANRTKLTELRELTSRVATNEVADTKRRLALGFDHKERLDVALATNMISVGLDITRLGLMVVLGQPKMASEYIQATSRVGRDDQRPGLVVALLNIHRPRDRSHYERFGAWHASFYRSVEATSVTPYSARALERGLAGVVVGLARLGRATFTPPKGAAEMAARRAEADFVGEVLSRRAEGHDTAMKAEEAEDLRRHVRARVADLLDTWARLAGEKGDEFQYQREVGRALPLLHDPLEAVANKTDKDGERVEPLTEEQKKFLAQRSLRDVEPTVALRLVSPDAVGQDEGAK